MHARNLDAFKNPAWRYMKNAEKDYEYYDGYGW